MSKNKKYIIKTDTGSIDSINGMVKISHGDRAINGSIEALFSLVGKYIKENNEVTLTIKK